MLDWNQCPTVERVPGKVGGAWLFKGTRVPVKALFENLEAGARVDDFLEWFPGGDARAGRACAAACGAESRGGVGVPPYLNGVQRPELTARDARSTKETSGGSSPELKDLGSRSPR